MLKNFKSKGDSGNASDEEDDGVPLIASVSASSSSASSSSSSSSSPSSSSLSSSSSSQPHDFDLLPDEIILQILSFVPLSNLPEVGRVDRRFRNLVAFDPRIQYYFLSEVAHPVWGTNTQIGRVASDFRDQRDYYQKVRPTAEQLGQRQLAQMMFAAGRTLAAGANNTFFSFPQTNNHGKIQQVFHQWGNPRLPMPSTSHGQMVRAVTRNQAAFVSIIDEGGGSHSYHYPGIPAVRDGEGEMAGGRNALFFTCVVFFGFFIWYSDNLLKHAGLDTALLVIVWIGIILCLCCCLFLSYKRIYKLDKHLSFFNDKKIVSAVLGKTYAVVVTQEGPEVQRIYAVDTTGERVSPLNGFSKVGTRPQIHEFEFFRGLKIIQVVAGEKHFIVVAINAQKRVILYGFGDNSQNQLGLANNQLGQADGAFVGAGGYENHKAPQTILQGSFRPFLAAGSNHNVMAALGTDGKVILYTWGGNTCGELGLGHTNAVRGLSTITLPDVGDRFSILGLAAGQHHTGIAILHRDTHAVYTWGSNEFGQLGIGQPAPNAQPPGNNRTTPQRVLLNQIPGEFVISGFSTGDDHTVMALSRPSTASQPACIELWGWGRNHRGQLGHANPEIVWVPHLIQRFSLNPSAGNVPGATPGRAPTIEEIV